MPAMWRLFALAAACSYTPGAPSTTGDGGVPDAPKDATVYTACRLAPAGAATAAGVIGGAGGGDPQPDLSCAAGELPIGMGFDLSDGNVDNGEHAVVVAHVRCGTIRRAASGAMTTTAAEVRDTPTGGFCLGWGASSVAEEFCPSGQVLVGMTANEAGGSLFNTVALQCAPVGPDVAIGTASTALTFPATGWYTNQPEAAPCAPGAAFVGFSLRTACGADELVPQCAPLTCD